MKATKLIVGALALATVLFCGNFLSAASPGTPAVMLFSNKGQNFNALVTYTTKKIIIYDMATNLDVKEYSSFKLDGSSDYNACPVMAGLDTPTWKLFVTNMNGYISVFNITWDPNSVPNFMISEATMDPNPNSV